MDMRAEKNPDIPAGAAGARKTKLKAVVFQAGPLIALVLLMAYLAFATSNFLTLDNLSNVARQSAFVAILAVGQTFVILTGGIDLSVAAIAALSASITAVLLTQPLVLFGIDFGFVPPPVAILIGILIGMAAGALNGWLISKFKIPDFIATLGTMTAFRGAALLVTDGLPVPSFNAGRQLPESLIWVGGGQLFGVPVSALIALLCAAAGWYVLRYTALGRAIYAVGGNRAAAQSSGISISRTKIMTYAISGLLAAIAGIILVGRLNSANALMADGEELRSIASVVIGGTNLFGGEGGVWGSIIGAAIIGVLGNGLNLLDVSPFWQRIAQGVVIVVVVIFDQWRRRSMTRV